MLGIFHNERSRPQTRKGAAGTLLRALRWPGCATAVLAAAGGEGAVDALVAAAKREGDPHQGSAFSVLDALAAADSGARERATSAAAALLPVAVAQIRAAAAGAASFDAVMAFQGPLLLLNTLTAATEATASARARALAAPGLAAAAVDLLMALGSKEWAAVREEWAASRPNWAPLWEELEIAILLTLAWLMLFEGRVARASAFDALTSRGALPRVFALLRSPNKEARTAACVCIAEFAGLKGGCNSLFLVPRATSELAAALRRAHADGEDPSLTQSQAARALFHLLYDVQGERIADGLVHAALAEGSAGPLLGALAGLLDASVDGGGTSEAKWMMFECGTAVVTRMVANAIIKMRRLRPVLLRSPVAGASVRALRHWLVEARDDQMSIPLLLMPLVASLAGFDTALSAAAVAPIPAATADTAAVRSALREAAGMEGVLRQFLAWARRQPQDGAIVATVAAATWLLRLPEVKAPAAAAVSQAAAAAAAGAAATAAGAPSAAAPRTAGANLPAMQQPRGGSSSLNSRSSGNSSSSGGGSGGGRSTGAAAQSRACGGCGKGEPEVRLLRCTGCKAQYYCGAACAKAHWPSHRAACKAAARRATAAERS